MTPVCPSFDGRVISKGRKLTGRCPNPAPIQGGVDLPGEECIRPQGFLSTQIEH
jgi:hypothetical protein